MLFLIVSISISTFIFYFLINYILRKINLTKIFNEYIKAIKELKRKSDFTKVADKITIAGSKLFASILIYFIPCLPTLYILKNFLNLSYFACSIIISCLYILPILNFKR